MPSMDGLGKGVDIEFAVDRSNRRKQEVVRFVSELTKLERAESRLVHTGLGHLFGESYVEAMSEAAQRILLVTSDSAPPSTEATEASQTGFERELRARATAKVEGFLSPDWLDPPTSESDRRSRIIFLGFTRCQMSSAYVLDKIRESLPPRFEHFLPKSQPVSSHPYLDCQLIPSKKQRTVECREFLSALEIYDPSHSE